MRSERVPPLARAASEAVGLVGEWVSFASAGSRSRVGGGSGAGGQTGTCTNVRWRSAWSFVRAHFVCAAVRGK